MLWSTLKRRIAEHVRSIPVEQFNQINYNAHCAGQTLEQYLDECDIRQVAHLREHARPAFPRELRTCDMLYAGMNDRGQWKVENKPC